VLNLKIISTGPNPLRNKILKVDEVKYEIHQFYRSNQYFSQIWNH